MLLFLFILFSVSVVAVVLMYAIAFLPEKNYKRIKDILELWLRRNNSS